MRSSETLGYRAFDYVYFQVLRSCRQFGLDKLFEHSPEVALCAADIQAYMRIPAHSTRLLLLAACAFGLLKRDETSQLYRLDGVLAANQDTLPVDFDWIRSVYLPSWSRLTDSLREGRNAGLEVLPGNGHTLYERLASYPELETAFAHARGETVRTRRMPLLLAAMKTLPEFQHVLDVGGGNGATAKGIAAGFEHVRVTVLDLPTVAEVGRGQAPAGLQGRIDFVGCDAFSGAWPQGADCVLFSAFLEIFSEDHVRKALSKAFDSLPPGGHVLVNQTICSDDETGPLWPAVLSLYFANLASGSGMTYPRADFERWCRQAGFETFRTFREDGTDACVMIAGKAA
jgi:ubiquinone/menaquinone biosynthesis C-methylase UbiE